MNMINNIYKYVNMYELPTVYGNELTQSVVLPTNMYEIPIVYQTSLQFNQTNGEITKNLVDPKLLKEVDKHLASEPLKDLLSRQQLLLKRLQVLENGLNSLDGQPICEKNESIDTLKSSQNKPLKPLTTSSSIDCNEEVLNSITKDIVIVSDGKHIPLSVLAIIKLMKSLGLKISIKHHLHSSLHIKDKSAFDEFYKNLTLLDLNETDANRVESRLNNDLIVTFIFKNISGIQMILSPNDLNSIESEANILRFMAKYAAKVRPQLGYLYEGIDDISRLTAIDHFVDEINAKIFINFEEKYVSERVSQLSSQKYLCPNSLTIADLLLWSGLNQRSSSLSSNLNNWLLSIKQSIISNETKIF